MHRLLERAAPLALLATGLLSGASARADADAHWRIAVADREEPVVRVIDVADGREIGRFATEAPAALRLGASGTVVYAVQGNADLVQAIDSGIAFEDHGEHRDLTIGEPRLLDARLEGGKPSHFVAGSGRIAVFFDRDGRAAVVREADFLAGSDRPGWYDTAAPHHGVAATAGAHVLVSVPDAEDPADGPDHIRVLDADGRPVGGDHACPDLHGEAVSASLKAIACATGLLLVTTTADGPAIEHLPYDAALPEGKATTLAGGTSLQYFLGNFGPSAVVLIEPDAEPAFRLVELPSRRVTFGIDPLRSENAYVMTEDGSLHPSAPPIVNATRFFHGIAARAHRGTPAPAATGNRPALTLS
ncbi:hypothetical protein [Marinivivus vitaminiproducens]|uniref:hypothetical protein n=1 Tax=Marinivivus vitaminiproducens TaxID=3035935 RepID=UPI0027A20337|nr:hypothetical protein P4R82_09085 [Geminicoccaceae bacterium SCSIO 64248]